MQQVGSDHAQLCAQFLLAATETAFQAVHPAEQQQTNLDLTKLLKSKSASPTVAASYVMPIDHHKGQRAPSEPEEPSTAESRPLRFGSIYQGSTANTDHKQYQSSA